MRDPRVLAAMLKVECSRFLLEAMQAFADEDSALSIEEGQTNSQPHIVARMAEAARARATPPPSWPSWRGPRVASSLSSGIRRWRSWRATG